jgi:DNA-binding response OmpR family regulator
MKVTIIDDEKLLSQKIAKKLNNQGYVVDVYHSVTDYMHSGDTLSDLYIVDLSLGDGWGFEIIKHLREKWCNSPILIMSGYSDTDNIINGLDIGADDYLTKPFSPEVLLARIKALLRRPKEMRQSDMIEYKDIVFNFDSKEVTKNGLPVYLARKENLILEILITNKQKVVSKENLIRYVWWWQEADFVSSNTLNATFSKLKKKLWEGFRVRTIYNTGYILE